MPTEPKEEFQILVCIADLPAADFQVPPEMLTEDVVAYLEKFPELPGVLIVQGKKLIGLITRLKLFERLGHRFGVELFLRKPVIELKDVIRTQTQPMPGTIKVDDAVQRALSRAAADIYDPVVVELDHDMYRILDIHVLLLAQSRSLSNLSNIVGKLQQVDNLIRRDWEKEAVFRHMLRLLGQVVPFHQAAIITRQHYQMKFAAAVGYGKVDPNEVNRIQDNAIFKMMIKHRQTIFLPDACRVPAWDSLEVLGKPLAWLGIPLLDGSRALGLLSLGRNINSPFNTDEKETSQAFAQRIIAALLRQEKTPTANLDTKSLSMPEIGREPDLHSPLYFSFPPVPLLEKANFQE